MDTNRAASRRSWRPSWLTIVISVLLLTGIGIGAYPMTAQWFTSYNQSQIIRAAGTELERVTPSAKEQLAAAGAYNDALTAGVIVGAGQHVATGSGRLSGGSFDYDRMLSDGKTGIMSRVKIPSIDVDLPIYHGTSDAALLQGAGHLEGSHLPVGGSSTRTVITAHRGLADATMFTNLDRVKLGDTFTLETFGRVLTYRVSTIKVIDPEDTDTIRVVPGKDLATLITCTPLGINSQRIVVTGERITPTPISDVEAAGKAPDVPGFPWWAVIIGGALAAVSGYLAYQGRIDARIRAKRLGATGHPDQAIATPKRSPIA